MTFPSNDVTQHCIIAYSAEKRLSPESVLIILTEFRPGVWKLLVRPDWQTIVEGDDQRYVREMLEDMKSRLSGDPENLFKQLSSLSVGPLITDAVGQSVQKDSPLADMIGGFVEV